MSASFTVAQTRSTITAQATMAALQAALDKALELNVAVNIAIVDQAGLPSGFIRSPGAALHSIQIATDKAYTAASFGLPTRQWHDVLAGTSQALQQGIVQQPRFIAFGGGLPIMHEGQCIGGIGVSGASEEQDEAIAQAGLDVLA